MARPSSEERVLIAQRRARVLAMRIEGRPYHEIAAALAITEAVAEKDYQRARDAAQAELGGARDAAVAAESLKLDALERAAWQVLRNRHVLAQQGKIVRDDDGNALEDDAPTLQAIDRILKIAERRARMRGLDAPVRAKVEVTDALDADIERLVAELAGLAPGGEAAPAGPPGGRGEPPQAP